jgi:uncharacterized integral membrane protein
MWVLKLALFVVVLTFAVRNTDPVGVRYYFGVEWQAPLVLVLLVAFCAGVLAGLAAALAHIVRQRREIAGLRRDLARPDRAVAEPEKRTEWGRA